MSTENDRAAKRRARTIRTALDAVLTAIGADGRESPNVTHIAVSREPGGYAYSVAWDAGEDCTGSLRWGHDGTLTIHGEEVEG